jgi:hypothetical protein
VSVHPRKSRSAMRAEGVVIVHARAVAATCAAMRDDDDDGDGASRCGGSLVDFVFDCSLERCIRRRVRSRCAHSRE